MKTTHQQAIRTAIFTVICTMGFTTGAQAKQATNVSQIDSESNIITMVNVLTPQEGKQGEVIQRLQAGMDETMRHQPGFISANVHKSLNSNHVVVYAQWKDQKSVDAATKLIMEGQAPNMASVFTMAEPAFHPYEVISIHPAAKIN